MLEIPDEVLQKIADLAHVPTKHRDFFFQEVRMHVQTAYELDQLAKQGLKIEEEQRERLAGAALTLYDGLGNLKQDGRALIQQILESKAKFLFDRLSENGMDGLEETTYQLALLLSLITGKPPPRLPSQYPEPPGPGRRSGTVKNPVIRNLAWNLLVSTREAGGRLPLEKNIGTGAFVKVLDALTPYLPDQVMPSASTLQRLINDHIKTTQRLLP
jgi:hypothetical protein